MTTAYVGIGVLSTNPVFEGTDDSYAKKLFEELQDAGAVGDVAMRFFDEDGNPVQTSLDDLIIGSQGKSLKTCPGSWELLVDLKKLMRSAAL